MSPEVLPPSLQPESPPPTQPVAFLGLCQDVNIVGISQSTTPEVTLVGLKTVVASFVFPLALNDLYFVFAVSDPATLRDTQFAVLDASGKEAFALGIGIHTEELQQPSPAQADEAEQTTPGEVAAPPTAEICFPCGLSQTHWAVIPVKPGAAVVPLVIYEPGDYTVVWRTDRANLPVGHLLFIHAIPAPLTPERIAAIQARPQAAKSVRIEVRCRKCGDTLRAYAALERNASLEVEGWTWHSELPDRFSCHCGGIPVVSLTYIRSGLHGLLGDALQAGPQISFTHIHDARSLQGLYNSFSDLLAREPEEEAVQEFIEAHPILLQSLSPERLYFKRPVLTRFNTDIAVVTHRRDLLFIELEKPSTPILTKSGGQAAPLTHAFDQVRNWLVEADNHGPAVLQDFDLQPSEVSQVAGVVIAGRDALNDPDHLIRLKYGRVERIEFLTYDDILRSLGLLIRSISKLAHPAAWDAGS